MKIFATRNVDDNVRLTSSSGGVFYALASWVLQHGGVVIGVAFGETAYDVRHIVVDNKDDLLKLQKSKYAPSSMANQVVVESLRKANNIWVLFSGTPCQVMAVRKKYGMLSKLLLVEIACHGVPTKEAYYSFLKENDIVHVDFRCKRQGWKNAEIEMIHSDGSVSYQHCIDNSFYKDYVSGKNLRKSCLSCSAKYFKSGADFTLADFWGVDAFVPELDDNKGTSLVFLHTKKAEKIWNKISNMFLSTKVAFYEATHWNPCIYRPFGAESTMFENWEEKKYVIKQYLKKCDGGTLKIL